MAVGRLKKETNPLPGYEPGFLPQHERADGEFQTTGENHPLPTGNYVQTNSGVWIPQKGSDDGAAHVQLTGSLAELTADKPKLIKEFSYEELSAGSTLYKAFLNVLKRNVRERTLIIVNGLDVNIEKVEVLFCDSSVGDSYFQPINELDTELRNLRSESGGSTPYTYDSKSHPVLATHADSIQFGLKIGSTAPTTGFIKIYVTEVL